MGLAAGRIRPTAGKADGSARFGYIQNGTSFRKYTDQRSVLSTWFGRSVVSTTSQSTEVPARSKRADALRNQQALLAAAAVFVTSGVDAPIREIAARAGVGIGTIYRHFPTRADLVVAVYRHQVEACAEAGPALLADAGSPLAALRQRVDLFADFLVTKHGLANALQSDSSGFDALHAYFLDRLVPVCQQLLDTQSTLTKSGPVRTPTN